MKKLELEDAKADHPECAAKMREMNAEIGAQLAAFEQRKKTAAQVSRASTVMARLLSLVISVMLMPNYRQRDGSCSLGSLFSHCRDFYLPWVATEAVINFGWFFAPTSTSIKSSQHHLVLHFLLAWGHYSALSNIAAANITAIESLGDQGLWNGGLFYQLATCAHLLTYTIFKLVTSADACLAILLGSDHFLLPGTLTTMDDYLGSAFIPLTMSAVVFVRVAVIAELRRLVLAIYKREPPELSEGLWKSLEADHRVHMLKILHKHRQRGVLVSAELEKRIANLE